MEVTVVNNCNMEIIHAHMINNSDNYFIVCDKTIMIIFLKFMI